MASSSQRVPLVGRSPVQSTELPDFFRALHCRFRDDEIDKAGIRHHPAENREDFCMKYLCQVWLDEQVMAALSPLEHRELDRQSLAYDRELAERGHLLLASPLASPDTALTLRVRQGQLTTTDGPFTESREHLGGFLLIEARDFAEATQLASQVPIARYGSIEVRALCHIPEHDEPAMVEEAS
jgi:hypothetical protein